MAKKKKGSTTTKKASTRTSKKTTPRKEKEPIKLSDEVISFIVAVVFFVVSVFMLVAAFSYAGIAGDFMYNWLSKLLGLGYFLLPLLFFILAVSFFYNIERNFSKIKIFGSALFLIAGLGILELLFAQGGWAGAIIASIKQWFGTGVTVFAMIMTFVVSLAIIYDATPEFKSFRRKKKQEEKIEDLSASEEKEINKAAAQIDTEVEEKPKKSFLSKKEPVVATETKESDESKMAAGINTKIKKKFLATSTDSKLPPLSLLSKDSGKPGVGDIKEQAHIIKKTLANFGIEVEMDEVAIGPTVTRYSFKPAQGVKLSRIAGLQDDLALALAAKTLRMETPIPGKSLVGIEIPNKAKTTVGLGSLLDTDAFVETKDALPMAVGKDIAGQASFINMAKAPHMLIAGATGAGKSVTVHALITSLLYKHGPDMLKFIMVDPKRVELTLYNGIPHLLTPTITDPKSAILALKWAVKEMNRRYDVLQSHSVRDIGSYHNNIYAKADKDAEDAPEAMPYIVIVIDELADIMLSYPRELEAGIVALAQMSRAVGIHLILSTQRPSVNVITGLIKANIPTRIALKVASAVDSRTILDMGGAEKLLGAGDALYMTGSMSNPVRVQSAFIPETEVKKIVSFLKKNYRDEVPEEIDLSVQSVAGETTMFAGSVDGDDEDDERYEEAKATVLAAGKGSTSYLQRKLRVGYSRAARLIDLLEERGVLGPAEGSKPREVILQETDEYTEEPEQNEQELLDDSEPEVYTPPTNANDRF